LVFFTDTVWIVEPLGQAISLFQTGILLPV
jgi:hypothetical protein